MVEGGSPNTLLRRGANKNTFPEGTEVVVDGYQARDHNEKRANARNVTFADGRKLFLGMTGDRRSRSREIRRPRRRRRSTRTSKRPCRCFEALHSGGGLRHCANWDKLVSHDLP